ncbi:MAG TPA: PLD nuclease N-terminal domain-containing protein [Ktedonobacteraceae bacterium]|nr:PLD nuclease N-terminal domain-containing protein [Ktedonobacteraceae bacterium]
MSSNRGCLFNSLLFLVIVFIPLLGHVIETVMVLQDDHSSLGMLGWLLLIWLVPFVGPFLYLVFGQKRTHVYFGQPSYAQNTYQQQRQTY